jgi:hypothetical protein
MSEPGNDPAPEDRDELLAELDELLEHGAAAQAMTSEQRRTLKQYVIDHQGEMEWLREQCRKLEEGSISAGEAQKWFEAFVEMEGETSS